MKKNLFLGVLAVVAGSVVAAQAASDNALTTAAQNLAKADNYSWKTTVEASGRFRPGPVEGKTEKDGYTVLTMTRRQNTIEAVLKGDKGAVKTEDGWKSFDEMGQEQGGRRGGRFLVMMLRNYKAPAAQAEAIAAHLKEVTQSGDVYSSDLTEQGVKALLRFGRRRRDNGPSISNAKGSAKFWVEDGKLSKLQYTVQATIHFNQRDFDIDRTTTVEIKDVGSTKVDVPQEAKDKLM